MPRRVAIPTAKAKPKRTPEPFQCSCGLTLDPDDPNRIVHLAQCNRVAIWVQLWCQQECNKKGLVWQLPSGSPEPAAPRPEQEPVKQPGLFDGD